MRSRDLKKLKPGQKVLVKLSKFTLAAFPDLASWNNRIVYVDRAVLDVLDGEVEVRSSKKVRSSTRRIRLFANEVIIVNELDTAVLSLRFNSRR